MVKRRRNGSLIYEDEKRSDECTSSAIQPEANLAENTITSTTDMAIPQPSSSLKCRIHLAQATITKETPNASESEAETKTPKVGPVARSSTRAPKRIRKDPSDAPLKKAVSALKRKTPLKTRRPWELWSVEDKNAFFEALCEFGKDFESIQSYIAQRGKKRGYPANMIKNKDQVRFFYYRTWHKISKFLVFDDDVRKQTQEIYGLINYAELRKKVGGCLDEKNRQKLNELVFNGATTVKFKGKKFRIKTPVCRALKMLNNITEPKEPEAEKLPKIIAVELRPKTNDAWLHVQNLAQNPRIRTRAPLQRRLKSVIEYLQHKWKPYRLKKKDQILSSFSQLDFSFFREDLPPILKVWPKELMSIPPLSISVVDAASSSDVCLKKHLKLTQENALNKEASKSKKTSKLKKSESEGTSGECSAKGMFEAQAKLGECSKASKDCERCSPIDNLTLNVLTPPENCIENAFDEAQRSLSFLTSMLNSVNDKKIGETQSDPRTEEIPKEASTSSAAHCTPIEDMYWKSNQEGKKLTLGQLLSLGTSKRPSSPERTSENENVLVFHDKEPPNDISRFWSAKNKIVWEPTVKKNDVELPKDLRKEEITKDGWTIHNVGLLTVGELYLMLGRPSKIVLEYEFQEVTHSEFSKNSDNNDKKQTIQNSDSVLSKQESVFDVEPLPSTLHKKSELASTMKRLVQVALNTFAEIKSKQNSLSPTSRSTNQLRVNIASLTTKPNSRCTSKSSNIKSSARAKSNNIKNPTDITAAIANVARSSGVIVKTSEESGVTSTTNAVITEGATLPMDQHIFVVPIGTAPRPMKKPPPTHETIKEELDKLLPCTRRGCRVRRKPLVVQRPLLPRENTIPGAPCMTVVRLPPQLAAVLPPDNKTNMLPSEKVVKILSTGSSIQVPLLKQMKIDAKEPPCDILLKPNTIATHVLMTPTTSQSRIENPQNIPASNLLGSVDTIINNIDKTAIVGASVADSTQLILPNIVCSAASIIQSNPGASTTCSSSSMWDKIVSSPPQITIPDITFSSPLKLSPNTVRSFLSSEAIPEKSTEQQIDTNILDFSENSTLSAFGLPTKAAMPEELSSVIPWCTTDGRVNASENTPPQSPPERPFRINSPGPDGQWLNGESGEFSLNTLLNTLESPCKVLSVSSSSLNLGSENSNLDSISRLAPVMDSQVRCLLDEGSVDFIAKFENLADVINSSHNESKH